MSTPEITRPYVSSIPSPEVVSQSIVDLTNETFARLMPRIAMFGRDPRRQIGESGIDLTVNDESRMWDENNGKIAIRISDRGSYSQTAESFLGDSHVKDIMRSSYRTHGTFVDEAHIGFEDTRGRRYKPLGSFALLHALRDRYPRGNTGAVRSWWAADKEYTDLPPEEWGERHKVGIELVSRFDDVLAPERPATWRFGMYVQSRFDKPEPQMEIKSSFDGLVDTRDMGGIRDFEPKMSEKRRATHIDVGRMAAWFRTAKDIRPFVGPAAVVARERALLNAMFDDFFHGGDSASEAAEVST